MSLITGNDAVEAVVKLINNTQLTGFSGRAYYYKRPPKVTGEYIVVNHLPFARRDAVEEGTLNINVHVPQTLNDEPDSKRLSELSKKVAALFFPNGVYLGKSYFEFYADFNPVEEEDGTYFVTIQVKVTFNNLNY